MTPTHTALEPKEDRQGAHTCDNVGRLGVQWAAPTRSVRAGCALAWSPIMKADNRTTYVTRETILQLLSDDEVATVSTAETSPRLAAGDEYVDLEHLDDGVRRAGGAIAPMGRLLPKKAVHEATWAKILTKLPAPPARARV